MKQAAVDTGSGHFSGAGLGALIEYGRTDLRVCLASADRWNHRSSYYKPIVHAAKV